MRDRTAIDSQRTAILATPADHCGLPDGPLTVIDRPTDLRGLVQLVADTVPDLVVLDDRFGPDLHLACAEMTELSSVTKIVLSVSANDAKAHLAIIGGASSAVPSTAPSDVVLQAAIGVLRGESVLSRFLAERVLQDIDRLADSFADPFDPPPTLSSTEREVLTLLATGHVVGDIAEYHAVTPRLVNLHVGYAVSKLQRFHRELRLRGAAATKGTGPV